MADLKIAAATLLREAQAIRDAFQSGNPTSYLDLTPLPQDSSTPELKELRYLHAESLLVQSGKTNTLAVLDDEMACVARLLAV
jgi:hypothetical protein